jgi:hypothetical protein
MPWPLLSALQYPAAASSLHVGVLQHLLSTAKEHEAKIHTRRQAVNTSILQITTRSFHKKENWIFSLNPRLRKHFYVAHCNWFNKSTSMWCTVSLQELILLGWAVLALTWYILWNVVEIVTYHHNHECELCIRKVEHWNQYRNTVGHDEIFLTLDFKGNAVNGTSTK